MKLWLISLGLMTSPVLMGQARVTKSHNQNPIPHDNSKVLVMGDSIMGGIAPEIKKLRPSATTFYKVSSGLVREDFFNWPSRASQLLSHDKYDYVVALFGANDAMQGITDSQGFHPSGTTSWDQAYTRRVNHMLDLMCKKATKVFWLGQPPMRLRKYNSRIENLNRVVQTAVQARSQCAKFVSMASILSTNGSYTPGMMVGGQWKRVRAGDGIHLSYAGGRMVAQHVLGLMGIPGF